MIIHFILTPKNNLCGVTSGILFASFGQDFFGVGNFDIGFSVLEDFTFRGVLLKFSAISGTENKTFMLSQ